MSLPEKYDVIGAMEDADSYDILQGWGESGRESALAFGEMLGNDTGKEIVQTGIDFIDAGMESLANLVSGL